MRPVGAPDAAIAEFADQLARERHGVGIRRALPCRARSAPLTFIQTFLSCSSASSVAERRLRPARAKHRRAPYGRSSPAPASAGSPAPVRRCARPSMCICKCQPSGGEPLAEGDDLVDRRACAEMRACNGSARRGSRRRRARSARRPRSSSAPARRRDRRRLWRRARRSVARSCRCRARPCARSRSARCRATRAARTTSPSARRPACICGLRHRESARAARTRAHARRRRPGGSFSFGLLRLRPSSKAVAGVSAPCQHHASLARVRSNAGSRAESRSSHATRRWMMPARQSTGLRQSR